MKNAICIWVLVLLGALSSLGCDSTSHLLDCADGCSPSHGQDGANGAPGHDGQDGQDGTNGNNGHNSLVVTLESSTCSAGGITILSGVDLNDDDALAGEEVQYSAQVCNGSDGQDAESSPYQIVALIDPCGNAPGIYDEVFLQLANGTVLASFSDNANGKNTRFSVLTAGDYVTTDGSNCHVHVDNNGAVSW